MYNYKSHRATWAEIELDTIKHNLIAIQNQFKSPIPIMGVVKADAYGHGAIAISQELLKLGVEYLAVSNIDEAIELRNAGIMSPILLFGPVEPVEFGKMIEFNIYPTVISVDYARELSEAYKYRGIYPKIHIKVDTGMGRLGIPYENALMDIEQIAKMEGIIIDGIYTHFPAAEEDIDFSKEQINRFKVLITELKKIDIKIKYFHAANSAAVFNLDDSINPPFNMVRVGLALYGYSMKPNGKIKNSLSLKTKIIVINKLKKGSTVSYQRLYKIEKENEYIAVLPVGYADGIPTIYSNKGKVVIKDVVYPIAGKICMDYMMVSLGDNSNNVQAGDEVTLFGNDKISVENFAKACQKIPYEVTCDISKRVPRVYLRKEDKR